MNFLFCLLFTFISSSSLLAQVRSIKDVHMGAIAEDMMELSQARIAILDYDLLRKDFPSFRGMSNAEVDQFILSQVAFIAKPQAEQEVVNSTIPVTGKIKKAYRPPFYGRAMVFELKAPDGSVLGLIDAKGAGARHPSMGSHGNGLATLGEGLREYNYENLVRKVLADAHVPNKTVGSYGVIDAGFDVIHADGSRSRAGIYLRQAHSRKMEAGVLRETGQLQDVLRRYGIDPSGNIQASDQKDIFDFGHYVVRDDMKETERAKQIPTKYWGYEKKAGSEIPVSEYSKQDRPWIWAHQTAEAFAHGQATRDNISQHHLDLMAPVEEKLLGCNIHLLAK